MKERNKYFDFEEIINFLEKDNKKRFYYHQWIKSELKLYKRLLNEINVNELIKVLDNCYESQYFDMELFINNNSTSFFIAKWSIKKAKEIIIQESLPVLEINIEEYEPYFKNNDINISYAKIANLDEPVIFAKNYCVKPQKILIDGNHRFYKAISCKRKTIKAYLLNAEQSLMALSSDEHRLLYKIYSNLIVLNNFNELEGRIKYNNKTFYQLRTSIMHKFNSLILLKFKV